MNDFHGAFDTKEEANYFIEHRPDLSYLYVEDMEEFLSGESPKPWDSDEINKYHEERDARFKEAMEDPIAKAIHNISINLKKDLYGGK